MKQIETISLSDIAHVFRRHIWTMLVAVIGCALIAIGLASFLEKRFKSNAILSIQTSYFQHPLVNDLITPVSDPGELQAQRLSLLKLALHENYLDAFAQTFGIYEQSLDATERAKRRELLSQRIEYYSMSPTTFFIAVTAKTPELSQEMTRHILTHMQDTLITERNNALLRAKNAIEGHLNKLGSILTELEKPNGYAKLDEALQGMEASLKGLLVRFTASHPDVVRAKRELATLQAQKASSAKGTKSTLPSFSKAPSQQVYDELIKKLNYLTVLFDMEKGSDYQSYLGIIQTPSLPVRAIFPSKRLFALFGMMIGTIIAGMIIVTRELRRTKVLSPTESAVLLDAPWWGTLPLLNATSIKGLEAPQKLLPSPDHPNTKSLHMS